MPKTFEIAFFESAEDSNRVFANIAPSKQRIDELIGDESTTPDKTYVMKARGTVEVDFDFRSSRDWWFGLTYDRPGKPSFFSGPSQAHVERAVKRALGPQDDKSIYYSQRPVGPEDI